MLEDKEYDERFPNLPVMIYETPYSTLQTYNRRCICFEASRFTLAISNKPLSGHRNLSNKKFDVKKVKAICFDRYTELGIIGVASRASTAGKLKAYNLLVFSSIRCTDRSSLACLPLKKFSLILQRCHRKRHL